MRLVALKVIYQLVVAEIDDDGSVIGEHPQPPVTLYRPEFGQLAQRIDATMATVPSIAFATSEESGESTGSRREG